MNPTIPNRMFCLLSSRGVACSETDNDLFMERMFLDSLCCFLILVRDVAKLLEGGT